MHKITWSDAFSVGNDTIDNDHRKLIELINRFIDAVENEHPRDDIIHIFEELEAYTRYHFSREDRLFTSRCRDTLGQVYLHHHFEQHRYFIDKLAKLKRRLVEEEEHIELYYDTAEFLAKWLIEHIIDEDLRLNTCHRSDSKTASPLHPLLSKLSIFGQIKLTLLFPFMLVLLLSLSIGYHLYERYTELDRIEKLAASIKQLDAIVMNLQIERGMSATMIASHYRRFQNPLREQRKRTDRAIDEAMKHKDTILSLLPTQAAYATYRHLRSIRRAIDDHNITRTESNRYYTTLIRQIIDAMKQRQDSIHIQEASFPGIMLLVESSETIGMIRNEGAFVIEHDLSYKPYLRRLANRRQEFDTLLSYIADPVTNNAYTKLQATSVSRIFDRKLRTLLRTSHPGSMDSQAWFHISTQYLNQYFDLIRTRLHAIYRMAHTDKTEALRFLIALGALLLGIVSVVGFFLHTLKQNIIGSIQEVTGSLQALSHGDKRYRPKNHAHDPVLAQIYDAIERLRRSLIKADTNRLLHQLQQLKAKRFEKMAHLDALTRLPNKRALEEYVQTLQKTRSHYAVAILDLDHFKRINDTYGHDAGDVVLQRFAHALRQHLRDDDFFARIGGEEFMLIVEDTTRKQIRRIADKLRQVTETIDFSDIDTDLKLTVSIGIADTHEVDTFDFHHLFKRADTRLYQAKTAGRNRIVA